MSYPGELPQGKSFVSLPRSQSQTHCACPTCGNRNAPKDTKAAKATTAKTELLGNMTLILSSNRACIENNFATGRLLDNRQNNFFILYSFFFSLRKQTQSWLFQHVEQSLIRKKNQLKTISRVT